MPPREALASPAATIQGRRPGIQTNSDEEEATTTKPRAGAPDILVLQIKSRSSAPLTVIEIGSTTN